MYETPKMILIGIGNAGCNIVNEYQLLPVLGIDTKPAQDKYPTIKNFILAGGHLASGTRGNTNLGKKLITGKLNDIYASVKEYDVIFLVAGLGGGTGSSGLPAIASHCMQLGKKVYAIATFPFPSKRTLEICNSINTIVELNELNITSLTIFQTIRDGRSLNDSTIFYNKACHYIVNILIENNIFFVSEKHMDSALSKVINEAFRKNIMCYDGKSCKKILNDDYRHHDLDSHFCNAEYMQEYPISQCIYCIHFHEFKHNKGTFQQPTCDAFPDGIPEDIMWSIISHDVQIPGDNNIIFERNFSKSIDFS